MQWLGASKYETLLCAHSADGHLVAAVAQRIEHRSSEPSVGGSNPSSRTKRSWKERVEILRSPPTWSLLTCSTRVGRFDNKLLDLDDFASEARRTGLPFQCKSDDGNLPVRHTGFPCWIH